MAGEDAFSTLGETTDDPSQLRLLDDRTGRLIIVIAGLSSGDLRLDVCISIVDGRAREREEFRRRLVS